ncbi:hypothetical protein [Nocardioides speluncae]|uniref:sunset domain-containing protein n=1 Tax=Nocardioides speluncae TaxID=2670337 RepID=UPI000D693448
MMWLIKENWIWLLLAAILGAVITWLLIIRKVAVSSVSERTMTAAAGGAAVGAAGAAGAGLALDKPDADADLDADVDVPSADADVDLDKPSFGLDKPEAEAPSVDADLDTPSYDADFEDTRIRPAVDLSGDAPSGDLPSGDLPEASGGLDVGDGALAGGAGLAGAGLAGAAYSGGDEDLDAGVGETTRIRPGGSHRADIGDLSASSDADLSASDADLAAPEADPLSAPAADLSAPEADLSTPEADLAAPEADVAVPDAGTDADAGADAGDLGAAAGLAGVAGAGGFVAGKYAGSAAPSADGSAPAGYTVKGNEDSMIYHSTESPYYSRTKAEVWFDSDASAEAAGFRRWNAPDFLGGGAAGLAAVPAAGAYGEGSADPLEGGDSPHESFTIKGNADSMKYHTTESPYYGRTVAETWFNSEDAARGAGFVRWDDRSADEAPAAFAALPAAGAYGVGSADPLEGGDSPHESFTIKGNADSMKYHTTESPYYGRTVAETWFNSEDAARGAGFVRWDDRSGAAAEPATLVSVPEGQFGPGSADPLEGGASPDGSFTIKGNADSMLYHTEESPYYGRTIAETWFNSEDAARGAGFARWDER